MFEGNKNLSRKSRDTVRLTNMHLNRSSPFKMLSTHSFKYIEKFHLYFVVVGKTQRPKNFHTLSVSIKITNCFIELRSNTNTTV